MRILIDECLPAILRIWLDQYEVKTAQEVGWAGLTNGDLLAAAQESFDVFLTSDRGISHQQNLARYNIKLVVLPSNRLKVVRQCLPELAEALDRVKAGLGGQYRSIPMPDV